MKMQYPVHTIIFINFRFIQKPFLINEIISELLNMRICNVQGLTK